MICRGGYWSWCAVDERLQPPLLLLSEIVNLVAYRAVTVYRSSKWPRGGNAVHAIFGFVRILELEAFQVQPLFSEELQLDLVSE